MSSTARGQRAQQHLARRVGGEEALHAQLVGGKVERRAERGHHREQSEAVVSRREFGRQDGQGIRVPLQVEAAPARGNRRVLELITLLAGSFGPLLYLLLAGQRDSAIAREVVQRA